MAETRGFRMYLALFFKTINIESLVLHLGGISEHFFFMF